MGVTSGLLFRVFWESSSSSSILGPKSWTQPWWPARTRGSADGRGIFCGRGSAFRSNSMLWFQAPVRDIGFDPSKSRVTILSPRAGPRRAGPSSFCGGLFRRNQPAKWLVSTWETKDLGESTTLPSRKRLEGRQLDLSVWKARARTGIGGYRGSYRALLAYCCRDQVALVESARYALNKEKGN